MATVQEVLKQSGLTDEQIAALDQKVVAGFTTVISTAQQTLDQAELAKRAVNDQWESEISPALDGWANDKAAYDAKIAAYEAALKSAAEGGFKVPAILAPAAPARPAPAQGPNGQFVAGANPVPGSPQYMTKDEGYRAVTAASWFVSEYMRLHNGAPPPDDFDTVANEAGAQRMPIRDYVAKKYDFEKKRGEIKAAEQKKHDDAITKAAVEENDKKWAEKYGSNPMVRQAETSKFSTLEKAVKENQRHDPLKMTREQRHVATGQAIRKEIAENESVH